MKTLVNAREFDTFKREVLDPGVLTEYDVVLHGKLLEENGAMAYFTIPPKTAVVMFNLPGYPTWRKTSFLTEEEKKKLRRGNLAGRNPSGQQYAYSVMYVSGDTVPNVSVNIKIQDGGRGIYNKSGKKLNLESIWGVSERKKLSEIVAGLGPGLYFVSSCRGLNRPKTLRDRQNTMYLKRVDQVRKMQLANLVARSRQRPYSPATNMTTEPYTSRNMRACSLSSRSERNELAEMMSALNPMHGRRTVRSIARSIRSASRMRSDLSRRDQCAPSNIAQRIASFVKEGTTLAKFGIVTTAMKLDLDLPTIMLLHMMIVGVYKGAVRISRRGKRNVVRMASRTWSSRPNHVRPLTIHALMKSTKSSGMQVQQRILRKYGFDVGNARDIERKFYIHMQRIPLSNVRGHAKLNLAKRIADDRLNSMSRVRTRSRSIKYQVL